MCHGGGSKSRILSDLPISLSKKKTLFSLGSDIFGFTVSSLFDLLKNHPMK
jgi:hypothetical protein